MSARSSAWALAMGALLLTPGAAWGDALQMEYDYGLEAGEVEIGLLSYYTPITGSQLLGRKDTYPAGTRSDFYESILDLRLQVVDRWTTVLRAPMQLSRYEDDEQIEYAWGPGDVEWANQIRVLGDREVESVQLGVGLKLPTGNQDLELGSGTTDLSGTLRIHQFFDPNVDTYLQLEYTQAILGRPADARGGIFTHNGGISLTLSHSLQVMVEALGKLQLAGDVPDGGGYRLELAPGVLYELSYDTLYVAASLIIPLIQSGDQAELYPIVANLSLYLDLPLYGH